RFRVLMAEGYIPPVAAEDETPVLTPETVMDEQDILMADTQVQEGVLKEQPVANDEIQPLFITADNSTPKEV
ncbi:MAG: hypothetical protein RR253_07105, partial [Oscillospiraceae bacterium]